MRINTNLTALNTYNQYNKNNNKIASSVQKLSSGYSINSAADNAAGLAISEKMRAQIRGLGQASSNAQDAISLTQTAEGALSSSTEILQRMREISVQSSNDTNGDSIDREALQDEFSQLQGELDDISSTTTFNKKNLLDGSLAKQTTNLGSTNLANSGLTVDLGKVSTGAYNFSVSTKLENAAVAAKAPTTAELVMGDASTYFSGTGLSSSTAPVELGDHVEKSSLLNGNYSFSASYANPKDGDGQLTVTASGDNGQVFTATVTAAALENLTANNSNLALQFNADADDAFTVNLSLAAGIQPNDANFISLADQVSKLNVSIAGGVTAKDAEYGVYANLTGASSIKLSSGMDNITFDNGVKVNFNTLTASSVDTANKAEIADTAGAAITKATSTWSNLKATDSSTISNGALKITSTLGTDGIATFTAKDDTGAEFKASAVATGLVSDENGKSVLTTLNFADASGAASFSLDYTTTTTDTGAAFTADGGGVTAIVSKAGHNYTKVFGDASNADAVSESSMTAASTTKSITMGKMVVADGSTVAAGSMTFTSAANAGDATSSDITAMDANGNKFTATLTDAQLGNAVADTEDTSATTTLTFADADGHNAFTIDMTTVAKTDATNKLGVTDIKGSVTLTNDLSASTASSFNVEATENAGLTFQVGADSGDDMTIHIDKMDSQMLGVSSAKVDTHESASAAIKTVDAAINQVSSQRAYLGAIENRLDYKIDNLNTTNQNVTSAESQIRDVDMASEMTNFTNANILSQASTAMLAQANSLPKNVLSLLG